MTTSKNNNGRRRGFALSLFIVIAFLALAASPALVEAKKKTPAPAPAPSPALVAEAARAREASLESSRAEAEAAAAASRALDDLPRGSGTRPFQLQYLGTHRSYRVAPSSKAATAFLRSNDGAAALAAKGDPNAPSLLAQILSPVTREPLAEQAEKGIRAFHLDAWGDGSSGGDNSSSLYSSGWAGPKLGGASSGGDRRGRGDAASAASSAAIMNSNPRAFKVFSDPDFDGLSVCATLSICLADLKGWSDARPGHSPVVVFVEPRDESLFKGSDVARVAAAVSKNNKAAAGNGTEEAAAPPPRQSSSFDEILKELTLSPGPTSLASPPKIDAAALVALDEEIRAALGGRRGAAADSVSETEAASAPLSPTLFAPEDLRAAANMSSGSLLARNVLSRGGKGWPDVDALRGRILVVIVGKHAALYAETMAKTKKGGGAGGKQAAFAAAPSQDAAGPDTLFLDLAPKAIAVDQSGKPVAQAPAKVLAKWEDAVSTAARSAFLVRASADFAGVEAAASSSSSSSSSPSSSRAEAMLRSGATFVMTDYPPFAPDPTTGYSVSLKRGGGGGGGAEGKKAVALRCNPAAAPRNAGSLAFAEVGCAAVPPPTAPVAAPKREITASAAAAAGGVGGEVAAVAAPESPPPPAANGDGPSPDDPYYGGDGTLLVVAAPTPAPVAPLVKKPQPLNAVSSSAVPASASKAAAAVSTAARPKSDAEVISGPIASAAGPVDDAAAVAPAAPSKKASWTSPVETASAAAAPLDADAAAVPPALAAADEAAAATAAPVAAAKPAAAAAAAPAPRRPGYATPAGAGGEERVAAAASASAGGSGRSSSSNIDDAPAAGVPRRRFLDPNATPETGANGPSYIPLGPSTRIESGDSPDASAAVAVPAAAATAAVPVVAEASAADGEVATSKARSSGGGAKRAAADSHARPRGFNEEEEEEANSITGVAALAMPSLLP